jgi:hypothetical protein
LLVVETDENDVDDDDVIVDAADDFATEVADDAAAEVVASIGGY